MQMKFLDQKGQGLTEYIILLVLVSLVSIGAVTSLGKHIKGKIEQVRDNIEHDVVSGR